MEIAGLQHCPAFFFPSQAEPAKAVSRVNKSNSLFDQMYKLYLKRLVGKDTFKAMTGIEVKAMPKPRRVVEAKSVATNAILNQVQSTVQKEKTSGQSYNGFGGMRNTASTPWSQYNGYGGMRRTGTQTSSDTSGGKKTGETVTYTDWNGMSNYVKTHELTQQFGQTNVDMLANYLNVNTANMLFEGKQLTPAVDGLNHIWSNADYYIGKMGADSFLELFNKSSLQAAEQIDGKIKMLNERGLQITVDFVNTYLPEVAGQYKY